MYYICGKRGTDLGVMDTEDGVIEFYSKDKIESFRKELGIKVLTQKEMDEVVSFLHAFFLNAVEFGSSEYDYIIDCIESGERVTGIGGSNYDYIQSMKTQYNTVKSYGWTIKLSSIFTTNDKFVTDMRNVLQKSMSSYLSADEKTRYKCQLKKDWHLSDKILDWML